MAFSTEKSGKVDLHGWRKPYKEHKDAFTERSLSVKEPIGIFKQWFNVASETPEISEANAMTLATSDKHGKPSARIVLLKSFGVKGFTFFTNYNSRKGRELNENPYASLLFYWEPLKWQVRVEGIVEKVPPEESDGYFQIRPHKSQLAAIASEQSSVIRDREVLINKIRELEEQYRDPKALVPRPSNWGGFKLIPQVMEFWQGNTHRVHDRIRFRRQLPGETIDEIMTHQGEDGWLYERLAP
ncbi:pyridoxine-5'-phosphate oxidase-like isoform X1 [Limulus polyphemus]|uniref:pyridoxal 5'-phosphate synthase n=2 Tax=Limulus polyphemus TaxID=6850 RepID=A0ABM1C5L1_LIMPO|nr:pyridoxine-5'-phosphate oxidase-like isoform X1 [Limulus polyphemus]